MAKFSLFWRAIFQIKHVRGASKIVFRFRNRLAKLVFLVWSVFQPRRSIDA